MSLSWKALNRQGAGAATWFSRGHAVHGAGGPVAAAVGARQPLEDAAHGFEAGIGEVLAGSAPQAAQDEIGIVEVVQGDHGRQGSGVGVVV